MKVHTQAWAADHVDSVGRDRDVQVSLGHRTALVRAADVDVVPAS